MRRILLLVSLVTACEFERPPPARDSVPGEDGLVQESWNVHMFISRVPRLSDASVRRVEMIADHMARYERGDTTYQVLSGEDSVRVLVHLYGLSGDTSATMTADRVYYYEQQQRIEAEGSVTVLTWQGRRLETEALAWTEVDGKIRSDRFVRISTGQDEVQGHGLVAEEDLSSYDLGRFTARVQTDS